MKKNSQVIEPQTIVKYVEVPKEVIKFVEVEVPVYKDNEENAQLKEKLAVQEAEFKQKVENYQSELIEVAQKLTESHKKIVFSDSDSFLLRKENEELKNKPPVIEYVDKLVEIIKEVKVIEEKIIEKNVVPSWSRIALAIQVLVIITLLILR